MFIITFLSELPRTIKMVEKKTINKRRPRGTDPFMVDEARR